MAEAICCPFCNSLFPRDQAQPTGRGLCCPRCGEPVPALTNPDSASVQSLPTGVPARDSNAPIAADVPKRKPRKANLIVAAIVLLVMGAMAWIGLELSLRTQDDRRRRDYRSPPGEWAGIGYLPAECNLILRLQVSDLDEASEIKNLLDEPRLPYVDQALTQLENSTGLKLAMIDYAILGIRLDGERLQASLVVATRKPYDPAQLVKHLKAEKMGDHHAKPVYQFQETLVSGRLWCPEQQIFILAMSPEFKKGSHEEFPFPPREDLKGQRERMELALKDRLQKNSTVWLAGDGDWKKTIDDFKGLASLAQKVRGQNTNLPDEKTLQTLAQINTFVLSVDRDLVVRGALRGVDRPAAELLQKRLESLSPGDFKLTVAGPPPEAPADLWVNLQARFTSDQLRKMIEKARSK